MGSYCCRSGLLAIRWWQRILLSDQATIFRNQFLCLTASFVTSFWCHKLCICAPHSEDLLSAAEETIWCKWNKYIFVVQFISMMYNHGQSTNNVLPLSEQVLMETESGPLTPKLCVKYKISICILFQKFGFRIWWHVISDKQVMA